MENIAKENENNKIYYNLLIDHINNYTCYYNSCININEKLPEKKKIRKPNFPEFISEMIVK